MGGRYLCCDEYWRTNRSDVSVFLSKIILCFILKSFRYEAQLEKDWKFIIENSGAKMILVANDKIYDKVKGYVGTVGQVHSVLSFDASEDYLHSYKKWMNMASKEADIPPAHISENDVAVLIYTSGTTGKPKGVKLSHRNFVEDFKGVKAIWKESLEGLEALAVLPWAHVFGQVADLHTMLATGSSIAILPSREQLIECLPIARPTLISAVPVLLNRVHDGIRKKVASQSPLRQKIFHWALSAARKRNHLLEFHQPVDFFTDLQFRLADRIVLKKIREAFGGRLRFMASGGAAAMLPVVQFFEDIGIPILEGYGLTETSPIITCGSLSWENRRLGCIGVPLPNIDVKILDPATLTFIPSAEEGEIVVSGPIVMVGYHDNPEADKAVFMDIDGKRYFRTGDLGRFIEGKFLKVTGRLKEQYKLENGKYVVPAPLEDDIARSHFIAQALIYGDNRPYNVALIVLDLVELKDWCAKNSISGADDMSKLAKHEKIIDLIAHELSQVSGVMKTYERPHRFAILDEAFTQENQFLTPKMSLRRVNILAKYASTVKALYEKTAGHDVPRSGVMSEKDQTP